MCDPTIAAVAGAGLSVYSANQQANDAENYQKQMAANAAQSASNQYQTIGLNDIQSSVQASNDMMQMSRQAAQQQATARAAAADSGVSGVSVSALLNDLSGQEAGYTTNTQYNLKLRQQQNILQRGGVHAAAVNRSTFKPVRADYIGAALSGAEQGISLQSSGASIVKQWG